VASALSAPRSGTASSWCSIRCRDPVAPCRCLQSRPALLASGRPPRTRLRIPDVSSCTVHRPPACCRQLQLINAGIRRLLLTPAWRKQRRRRATQSSCQRLPKLQVRHLLCSSVRRHRQWRRCLGAAAPSSSPWTSSSASSRTWCGVVATPQLQSGDWTCSAGHAWRHLLMLGWPSMQLRRLRSALSAQPT
jgi:hypothetical protein